MVAAKRSQRVCFRPWKPSAWVSPGTALGLGKSPCADVGFIISLAVCRGCGFIWAAGLCAAAYLPTADVTQNVALFGNTTLAIPICVFRVARTISGMFRPTEIHA